MFDWLYPKRCVCCDEILLSWEKGCCSQCKNHFQIVSQPLCYSCGKQLKSDDIEYCRDCRKHPKHFVINRAVFQYNEQIKTSLMRLKYGNRREYADVFGDAIVNVLGKEILSWNVDCIIPVPVYRTKFRQRGYNQAELLARACGKRLDIRVETNCIVRDFQTTALKELNPVERLENLEKAFHLTQDSVKLNKVIVLDDIYTTGATMEACARILRSGGVMEVYGITVAIGEGY